MIRKPLTYILLSTASLLYSGDLYQVSTFQALNDKVYESSITYDQVAKHGNFGLGTFNNTKGEMVALDGKFYQDSKNGTLSPVNLSDKTPFAAVTFF